MNAPFQLPADAPTIVHVLDLPLPPSVNRIWRAAKAGQHRVSRSPAYRRWINDAGMAVLVAGALRGRKTIRGKFTAIVEIQRQKVKCDLDNRTKALFDFCQLHQFISDDANLEEYTVKWTDENAPRGCRITLRSLHG